jgi:hypothetical protein
MSRRSAAARGDRTPWRVPWRSPATSSTPQQRTCTWRVWLESTPAFRRRPRPSPGLGERHARVRLARVSRRLLRCRTDLCSGDQPRLLARHAKAAAAPSRSRTRVGKRGGLLRIVSRTWSTNAAGAAAMCKRVGHEGYDRRPMSQQERSRSCCAVRWRARASSIVGPTEGRGGAPRRAPLLFAATGPSNCRSRQGLPR